MASEKKKKADRLSSFIITFYKLIGFGLFLFFLLSELFLPDERPQALSEYPYYTGEWTLSVEGSADSTSVTLPASVQADVDTKIHLATTLPDVIPPGYSLGYQGRHQDLQVYVNGVLRDSFTTINSRLFGKTSPEYILFVPLTHVDAGDTLEIIVSSHSPHYCKLLGESYFCVEQDYWTLLLRKTGVKTAMEVLLLLLSVILIATSFVLKRILHTDIKAGYPGWGILFCSIWILSESPFRQLVFSNISAVELLAEFSMILIPFPFIVYFNTLQGNRYRKPYLILAVAGVVNTMTIVVLQLLGVLDLTESIASARAITALGVLLIAGTIITDWIRGYLRSYMLAAVGMGALAVGAAAELVFYYILDINIGLGLVIAMIVLLGLSAYRTGKDLIYTAREKDEAVHSSDAQAKFLANMSHEIRTPINAIIGMNELISRESEEPAILEYSENINNSSRMLLGIINDILDMSKIESGQFEITEENYRLTNVILDEVHMLGERAQAKGLDIILDADPELPDGLYGDEIRIKQIITNLLTNAVKYTNQGHITLAVSGIYDEAKNFTLRIAVSDTGIGIKEEDLDKLFKSFTRLDTKVNHHVEGTGLGLNITYNLIERMNGRIDVQSKYTKGSTFIVEIPQKITDNKPIGTIDLAKRHLSEMKNQRYTGYTAPSARVLVVDDNNMNLRVFQGLLKRTLVQIDTASSGVECLKKTRERKYDIIFMDHLMPEMDGVETLKHLRTDPTNLNTVTKVIALTANAVTGSREFYLASGFSDYLSKPVDPTKLETMIAQNLPQSLIITDSRKATHRSTDKTAPADSAPLPSALEQISHAGGTDSETVIFENPLQQSHPVAAEPTDADLISLAESQDPKLTLVDREAGLNSCNGSSRLYKQMVKAFLAQSDNIRKQLTDALNGNDCPAYETAIHGLITSTKNIGATHFAEFSRELEKAASRGDAAFLKKHHAIYLENLQKIVDSLSE